MDACFCTTILDWTVFGHRTLGTILNLSYFVFILHLWSHCLHHLEAFQSISYANQLIGLWMIWMLWSKCIVLTLYMLCLFFFINVFALCYIYFCLLILLILWFVVIDVVVVHSLFNSFCCSCSSFSMYFFLSVISTFLFMLPLCIRTW